MASSSTDRVEVECDELDQTLNQAIAQHDDLESWLREAERLYYKKQVVDFVEAGAPYASNGAGGQDEFSDTQPSSTEDPVKEPNVLALQYPGCGSTFS